VDYENKEKFMLKREQSPGKPKWLLLVMIGGLLLISTTAMTVFHSRIRTSGTPPIDISALGTKDDPTTDRTILKDVLMQIETVPSFEGPGWVHLQYSGYQVPPDPSHLLHPKDGFHMLEEWFYVNSAGNVEKSLQTSADRQGNVLQKCACIEDICGNISLAPLTEYDGQPLSQEFLPYPYNQNSASSQLHEVDTPSTEIRSWVEDGKYGPVVYLSSYRRIGEDQKSLAFTPDFEGSLITLGVFANSGILAHFSLNDVIHGEYVVSFSDDIVLYETMTANPVIDQEIANVIAALKARDGK
jgi:hypothetical protein